MAVLDLFGLLVINMFGSILMAVCFLILCFFIFGGIMRMGLLLVTSISVLYMMIVLTAAYGGVVAVLLFFATSIYFVTSIIPWVVGMMNR